MNLFLHPSLPVTACWSADDVQIKRKFAYIGNRFDLVASKWILNDKVAVPMNVVVDNRHAHGHGHGHGHGHAYAWHAHAMAYHGCQSLQCAIIVLLVLPCGTTWHMLGLVSDTFTTDDTHSIISSLTRNKARGLDNLSAEHLTC